MAEVATANEFVAQLQAANLHPLWDRFRTITPVKPQPKDPPLLWRWRDIAPFTARAVAEVPIDDVERRALILVNPAFGGETVTTANLIAAFTVLCVAPQSEITKPLKPKSFLSTSESV